MGEPGRERCADGGSHLPGHGLVAEVADRLWRGPDPCQAGVEHRLRETCVLRQEAVSGMDRIRSRPPSDADQFVRVEICLGRCPPTESERLVGETYVERLTVLVRVDADATEARVLAGPYDTDRDLATIGDEDLAHVRLLLRPCPQGCRCVGR